MFEPLSSTIQGVVNFTWPMVLISTIIIVSFRVAYVLKNHSKFVLYQDLLMLCFIIYVLCLFQVVTFQDTVSWSSNNFIPFKEIFRYDFGSRLFVKNVLGNMILFLPFGFFISYYLKCEKAWLPVILTLIASCSIETVQMIIGRVFDIDDISKGFGYTINGETFYNYGVAIGLNKSKKFSSTMSRPLTTKNNGMLIAYDYNNINNRTFNNITFPNNPTMENEFLFFIRYKGKIIINKLSDNNTKISLGIIGLYNFSNYAIAYKIGEIDTSNGDQNKYIVMPFDIMLTKTSTFNTYTFGYEINGTTDNDLKSIDINKITWKIEVTQDNFS